MCLAELQADGDGPELAGDMFSKMTGSLKMRKRYGWNSHPKAGRRRAIPQGPR